MYLYPRATVELDPEELGPSPVFLSRLADALKGDQDAATRRAKFTKLTEHFGDGFAKTVQIGGMLHTTKEVSSNQTVSIRSAVAARAFADALRTG